jgi:hypothetical protein
MARYQITDPQTGKTVTISGDKPPSQDDAEEIFRQAGLRAAAAGDEEPGVIGTAVDMARSVPGAVAKTAAGIGGMVGDILDINRTRPTDPEPANWVERMLQYTNPSNVLPIPRSSQIAGALSYPTGGFYEPKTMAGRATETAVDFAPAAVAPGRALVKAGRVLLPAAASEIAGELTRGTPAEPYARVAGGVAGGGLMGGAEGLAAERAASRAVPTTLQLKNSAGYSAFASNPVTLTPEAINALSDRFGQTAIRVALNEAKINREPHLVTEFQNLLNTNPASRPATLTTEAADKIRQAFDDLAEKGNPNQARGWQQRSDDLENVIQQTPQINDARNVWARYRKSQIIDKAIDAARNVSGTPGGLGDQAEALRREFLKIARSRTFNTFSPSDQQAIKAVANGTLTANTLQQLGKLSPVRNGISRWGELMGVASGEWLQSLGIAAAGEAARQGSNLASRRAARIASETVRSGQKVINPFPQPVAREAMLSGVLGTEPLRENDYAARISGYAQPPQ